MVLREVTVTAVTSEKKRAYIALVGFCATALIVDQFVLSDSGPASAVASPVTGLTTSAVATPVASQPIPHIAFPLVAKEASQEPPRDFFAPLNSEGMESEPGAAPRPVDDSRLAFKAAAALGGVMMTRDGGVAVVNGKRMSPGDSLLGCKLEKVLGRSAHFRCSDGTAVLFIAPRSSEKSN